MSAITLAKVGRVKRALKAQVRHDKAQRAFVFLMGADAAELEGWLAEAANLEAYEAMVQDPTLMSSALFSRHSFKALLESATARGFIDRESPLIIEAVSEFEELGTIAIASFAGLVADGYSDVTSLVTDPEALDAVVGAPTSMSILLNYPSAIDQILQDTVCRTLLFTSPSILDWWKSEVFVGLFTNYLASITPEEGITNHARIKLPIAGSLIEAVSVYTKRASTSSSFSATLMTIEPSSTVVLNSTSNPSWELSEGIINEVDTELWYEPELAYSLANVLVWQTLSDSPDGGFSTEVFRDGYETHGARLYGLSFTRRAGGVV